ncbi:hypothetical protein COT48_05730 [Candidatus Woesearchaeota archaeon CG08_land_8_20_14_0_20_47_9]|nr:MAG: hypothetical protein AUJ69_00895 [Candidatus Woesearchaeota archaeon CG1_02_47_18]PIO03242.1 MAG: hypothetical protein COT48_05730 [Candidatus Woesearchaeota archaeon CG08_land_8_20_14_0_20_47_9]HII29647.1 DUF2073 domain-containing protein [Candidatus Woesearchaeota archaeon]
MLTLQVVTYQEIEALSSAKRIKKLLDLVKEDKIIFLEGRLKRSEEAELISHTMSEIDDNFKGIEICVVYPEQRNQLFLEKIRSHFINLILGDRQGLTIIGPASIIKEIRRNPDKIQLFTDNGATEASAKGRSNGREKRRKPEPRSDEAILSENDLENNLA